MKTYGRITIYANYTEEQLLTGTNEEIEAKIIDILSNSLIIHSQNKRESKYLQDYLYGKQDIEEKVKKTRTDINNKSVENWAYAFQDWKKAYLLGKPIQYAPLNNISNNEITCLNNYVKYENKYEKDQEIYEDIFTVGRGFRYTYLTDVNEDDESPLEILNLDVLNTEVVYSSSIKHEQLLSFVEVSKKYIQQEINPTTGQYEYQTKYYNEYNVYTRNNQYLIDNKEDTLKVRWRKAIIQKIHIIKEYYFNRKRESFLEIGKDIFNDINDIENLDKDDIEAFVNSIMVFKNAEITKEGMDAIREYGAVSIKSTEQKQADVEILQSRLKSLDTQMYYLRKLGALHSILSVPQATQNGEISNAETGKAVLTGQGFTSATVRVENEERAFERCDRNALKTILKICKNSSNSEIKNLKVSDIDIKFSRDLSDNLLIKTEALMNLASAQIPPEVRNAVVNLFNDPLAVTKLQEQYQKDLEEKQQLQKQLNQDNQFESATNNDLQDTIEKSEQEQ